MQYRFIVLFCLTFALTASAQDKHFSQFYASPISLNPALTGAINGTYRIAGIYRDQWRAVFDDPIVTYSMALDTRLKLPLKTKYKDALGVGLLFYSDKVNTIDFTTNQIMLSAAYHKALDYDNKQFLTIGIQGGVAQRNVNYERLSFADQFNGVDGYSGETLENLPPNNFSYGDMNVGINYTAALTKSASIFVGASMHHIFGPRISFYYDKEFRPDEDERLYRKYSAQLSAQLPIGQRMQLIPRVLVSSQGPHFRITAGSNIRVPLNDYNSTAVQLGAWARPVKSIDEPIEFDALVILAAIELNGVHIGLSYDLSFDDLATFQQGQNAFEISVSYIGSFENDDILCPSF